MCVAAALSMQSCLHDDNEVFSEPAAVRLNHAVSDTRALLESASNGWLFHYYTGEEYSGGGYTFLMKFQNGKVHVSGDIAPASMVTSSSYDVVKDQGLVLTINTYNEIMHYLAQPYQSNVEGEQGDFEFIVLKTEPNKVYLSGKKWKNRMVLERMPEDVDWVTYLTELTNFHSSIVRGYDLMIGGEKKGKAVFNTGMGRVVFSAGEESYDTPYSPTNNGFVLPETISLAGVELNEFKAVDGAATIAGPEGVTLEALFEPEYVIGIIGGANIGLGDEADVLTYNVPNGNKFTYTCNADWVDVTFADNVLTFTVSANNEGHARTASVVVANELGEAEILLTQADFDKDVAGSYLIGYWDAEAKVAFAQAAIGRRSSDGKPVMNFMLGSRVMSTVLDWDAATCSLVWMSGQHLGTYGNYQVFNIYYTDTYWSSIYDDTPLYAPVTYDEEDGSTFAQFQGSIVDEEINAVYLMACKQAPLTSTGDFLGYLEVMQYPMLLKMDDTEEVKQAELKLKSGMAAKRLVRPMAKIRQKPVKK